jgi:hypothetical protein
MSPCFSHLWLPNFSINFLGPKYQHVVRRGQHECQHQYPVTLEIWGGKKKWNAISVFPRHDNIGLFNHLQNNKTINEIAALPPISIDL